ncbi:MAG TPA: WD40 repeat domain-containing protein [Acetobacteraceae bacterium]|nr:WD40 repeat domain-containing protein [Acetobacteraceae bacterium]
MISPEILLRERGTTRELGEFVVGAAFAGPLAAFALGDGTVRIAPPEGEWTTLEAHDGAVLALAADERGGWVTGGDDGKFRLVAPDRVEDIASFGSKWVEHVAVFADAKTHLLACTAGKSVHVFSGGERLKSLDHPSTVTGIAFDAKGKRIAASHYNGCSLWFVQAKEDKPRVLEWKGSHIGVVLHPGGDAVVTAMQENALHGWRLADGQHMRMSGYPSKSESLSFSRTGRWLASSGADSVVLWPFFGGGPMGKPPLELAGGDGVLCSRVAFQPQQDLVAAGFADGLVVVADVASERILPLAPPGHGPVTALAWSPDGTRLAFGTETGFAALFDLSKR